jgi:uncharacterized protein (DUF1697 family)
MADHGWVALLRGINVGGKNKVPMAELRQLFEATGCGSVSSYIQSGNVLFTNGSSDRVAVARQLEQFGADTSQTYVAFLAREPEDAQALESLDVAPDRFELVGSDVYLHYPNGVTGARLGGPVLERRLGVAATIRNWRTVTRLAELAGSPG